MKSQGKKLVSDRKCLLYTFIAVVVIPIRTEFRQHAIGNIYNGDAQFFVNELGVCVCVCVCGAIVIESRIPVLECTLFY